VIIENNQLVSSEQFPILKRKIHQDKRLVYLDNSATTQKPRSVINAMNNYYQQYNSNVHRGIYQLSVEATIEYEKAHERVAGFIGARSLKEIVFTKNASESFNLLARMLEPLVNEGDEIVLSQIEHHSNLIPWQKLAERKNAVMKYFSVNLQTGLLDLSNINEIINSKTKIVCITHVSNVLGTIVGLHPIIQKAHEMGAKVVIDGAQSVGHFPVNVRELDADFYCFSGHKMYAPTGIGVLYGKESLLEQLDPVSFGGNMVKEVTFEKAVWADLPWKFEPGTPPIAEGIGLMAAVDFLENIGMQKVFEHEQELTKFLLEELSKINGLTVYGPVFNKKIGVASFTIKGIHSHDLATLLDQDGVCVRAGHHCAMPLMHLLNIPASARASLGVHNTKEDIAALVESLKRAKKIFEG
jgi:cysteine desulfurase/selenocysteine lyase